ncbi:hypothetical protein ACHAXT_000577 [Thalassiosira profunda]
MSATPKQSATKHNVMIKRIDILFGGILIWTVVSTMLLVRQHGDYDALQRKLARLEKVKNFVGKAPKLNKKKHRKVDVHQTGDRKVSTKVNDFPFTRSLEKFTRSKNFYIYVVSTPASEGAPLEWAEVSWKDLVIDWGRETTFEELLQMSTPLGNNGGEPAAEGMQKKLVLHCLPKAASTTLRRACYKHMKDNCEAIEFPRQQDPFGYRDTEDFFRAVRECTDIDHFCVQGGDAEMSIINYEGNTDDRDAMHFVHMVPFRTFDDWVESAIKQIYTIDGNCDRIDRLLDECLGYRELYMELYPKSVLQLLTGMQFYANGKGLNGKDKHHILLYNYRDVDEIVTERHKEVRTEGTCPKEISEKFHACHDETLVGADAIRGLNAEKNRRRHDGMKMKKLLRCMRKGDCDERAEEEEEDADESTE